MTHVFSSFDIAGGGRLGKVSRIILQMFSYNKECSCTIFDLFDILIISFVWDIPVSVHNQFSNGTPMPGMDILVFFCFI